MSESTARFGLPFLLPGQAQKEAFHNEALARIDAALHAAVVDGPLAAPPGAPGPGACWLVAAGATGAWAGKEDMLASWTDGGWRFIAPLPGMRVWKESAGLWIHWDGSSWSDGDVPAARLLIGGQQVVGGRQPEVPSPSGGTVIDVEARAALAVVIATLKSHGLTD